MEGATIVEFAIVAPFFLMMLMIVFDLGQMAYARAVLNGVVQQAARSSSLEGEDTAALDRQIKTMMERILPGVVVVTSRLRHYDFGDIDQMEHWEDDNLDGTCDGGEKYVDADGDERWSKIDPADGNGGANDVIIYSVTADYTPIFKVPFVPESWGLRRLSAATVRKNQPYGPQKEFRNNEARNCNDA